ncbi:Glycosyltransferase sdnJ [Colletotrichum aenigma]|uniref:Glycosyltransferase sdnJ n=1 Tax=Colletotrichum aenigma TaxID=1215731 RepID=UPI001872493D|nr:Glycosyltransferase sdnJ [Colletotrichum aenigma]KAF5502658.1 Glycosyltransferase sdnJ [Colletotrichum aenigma]
MADWNQIYAAAFVGILGGLVSVHLKTSKRKPPAAIKGRPDTILFAVNTEYGLSNVHLATLFSLLKNHPNLKIHIASFPSFASKVDRIRTYAGRQNSSSSDVVFHELPGPEFGPATMMPSEMIIRPPGIRSIDTVAKAVQVYLAPWTGEDHLRMHNFVRDLIRDLDPGVVVLDIFLRPAMDAARSERRLHAVLAPNVLADIFGSTQPWLSGLWKFPAMGSAHTFPIPWSSIPSNIYQAACFLYSMTFCPDQSSKQKFLNENGLFDPISYFNFHDPPLGHLICQDTPNASIPLIRTPLNVTTTGPVAISVATAEEQDPELANWMKKAPTVLINLGSFFRYDEERARAMAGSLKVVLERTEVQVLWKIMPNTEPVLEDGVWMPLVVDYVKSGRLRVEKWLSADPLSLLETGHVILSVHHGGASSYHEAVSAGVPHLVVPAWLDCYNYAALAESFKLGVRGNYKAAPGISQDELTEAFLTMLDGGPSSVEMRTNAKRLAKSLVRPGRDVAADRIAELATDGR